MKMNYINYIQYNDGFVNFFVVFSVMVGLKSANL
jgi:hypothetical protein